MEIHKSIPAKYDKSNTNRSRRKYVDRKYLLCSTKFVLMKKCCQNIHIYIHIYIVHILATSFVNKHRNFLYVVFLAGFFILGSNWQVNYPRFCSQMLSIISIGIFFIGIVCLFNLGKIFFLEEFIIDEDAINWFGFFVLMSYQPSWIIKCQSHPRRRTVVVIFNQQLAEG